MLKEWIEYCSYMESPKIVHEWVGLFLLSSVMRRNVWIKWDQSLYPNFYLMILAPAGMRKTSSLITAKKILEDLNIITIAPDAVIREELIKQMAKTGKVKTVGEIANPIADMCIMPTEAATILNKDNSKLLDDLLPLFDCPDRWRYETKNSGKDYMKNVFLNILGATTPEQLGKVLPEKVTGSGLLSRFISIYYDKLEKIVIFPGDVKKSDSALISIQNKLLSAIKITGEIKLGDSFRDVYTNWRPKQKKELTPKQMSKLMYYANRRPIHLLKISMLSSVLRYIDKKETLELNKEDFDYAHSLLRRTENQMDKGYEATGLSNESALKYRVNGYLKSVRSTDFITLFRYFISDMNQRELTSILYDLKKAGLISITEQETNYDITYLLEG